MATVYDINIISQSGTEAITTSIVNYMTDKGHSVTNRSYHKAKCVIFVWSERGCKNVTIKTIQNLVNSHKDTSIINVIDGNFIFPANVKNIVGYYPAIFTSLNPNDALQEICDILGEPTQLPELAIADVHVSTNQESKYSKADSISQLICQDDLGSGCDKTLNHPKPSTIVTESATSELSHKEKQSTIADSIIQPSQEINTEATLNEEADTGNVKGYILYTVLFILIVLIYEIVSKGYNLEVGTLRQFIWGTIYTVVLLVLFGQIAAGSDCKGTKGKVSNICTTICFIVGLIEVIMYLIHLWKWIF